MLSVDQLVGRTLGEYQIERLLGHGQLSAVYMAQHKSQRRTVMVTTFNFPDSIVVRERFAERFAQEGAALVGLKHPNILTTYDFGEQAGFPYLVTAFVKGASLSQVLKQQTRLTPRQTLDILKQLAAGLDYAHSKGVTHGILSLSNVLVSNELTVQIAGFGLKTLLEVHGNAQSKQPQAHLFSESGTFLGSPEYMAPERVLGMPTDARSDIYALGIMLFELLSGTLPFRGSTPLESALKRVQQPVPSLHTVSPDVSQALDLVVGKALERDPARRYQRAGEIAGAFDRVLTVLEAAAKTPATRTQQLAHDPQITMPPTVNWFDEDVLPSGKWQLMPPIVTGHLPAVLPSSSDKNAQGKTASWSPLVVGQTAAHPGDATEALPKQDAQRSQASSKGDSLAGIDPFAWWSATSAKTPSVTPGTFTQRPPVRLMTTKGGTRRHPAQQDRRRLVTLIATGGAVAGVLAVGGISFAHFAQSMKLAQTQIANVPTSGPTSTQGKTPAPGATRGSQNTPTPARTPTPKPSPTKAAQPSPTAQPTQPPTPTQPPPTPTPPSHTGTVIGNTNQQVNTSHDFSNPTDGQGSLLIRLQNGNFVACEKACTHEGVPVYYDGGQQKLVCPAHGAIFDPMNGFSHVSGPGNGPLPGVSIHVNGDGTITTG